MVGWIPGLIMAGVGTAAVDEVGFDGAGRNILMGKATDAAPGAAHALANIATVGSKETAQVGNDTKLEGWMGKFENLATMWNTIMAPIFGPETGLYFINLFRSKQQGRPPLAFNGTTLAPIDQGTLDTAGDDIVRDANGNVMEPIPSVTKSPVAYIKNMGSEFVNATNDSAVAEDLASNTLKALGHGVVTSPSWLFGQAVDIIDSGLKMVGAVDGIDVDYSDKFTLAASKSYQGAFNGALEVDWSSPTAQLANAAGGFVLGGGVLGVAKGLGTSPNNLNTLDME